MSMRMTILLRFICISIGFKLHVISVKEGKLIYYNQFVIKQFSDYVKYIMLVLNALNMDQQKSKVILWDTLARTHRITRSL